MKKNFQAKKNYSEAPEFAEWSDQKFRLNVNFLKKKIEKFNEEFSALDECKTHLLDTVLFSVSDPEMLMPNLLIVAARIDLSLKELKTKQQELKQALDDV